MVSVPQVFKLKIKRLQPGQGPQVIATGTWEPWSDLQIHGNPVPQKEIADSLNSLDIDAGVGGGTATVTHAGIHYEVEYEKIDTE